MVYTKSAEDYVHLGNFQLAQGRFGEAEATFKKAISQKKNYEIAHCNLGNVYLQTNNITKAIESYEKALKIKPNYVLALSNLGVAFSRQGKLKDALNKFQEAIEIDQDYSLAYVYIGNILLAQGNFFDAVMCYRMALEKDKKSSSANNNLGTAYARQLNFDEAIKAYKNALEYNPNAVDTLSNVATAYSALDNLGKSIEYYEKAYKLNPLDSQVIANLYHQLKVAGNWEKTQKLEAILNELTEKEIKEGRRTGEDPFINVVRDDNLKRNYQIAKLRSNQLSDLITHRKMFKFVRPKKKKKLRIGYFSGHFHYHPTGHLIAGLFSKHDRKRFEVVVYSHGIDDNSVYRNRINKSSDRFVDVSNYSFSDTAMQIHKDEIDILIDLDGYTDNSRFEVLALKPAPIQIEYLGFPGTVGADFMDYILTDKVVSPPSFQKYFSEKFIYLPDSYQVNDDAQTIAPMKYSRSHFNLPKEGIVFCSFNSPYKIDPDTFNVWMKILKKCPKSVLWLISGKGNDFAIYNFRREARKRGVHPKRLIFSKMQPREKHLARIALADIALDTFMCNGHTTTSDALWAGVPVITLEGKHFASRVASSILTASGMENMITKTPKAYESLAIRLAKDPKALLETKLRLKDNKTKKAFFNTKIFVKNLEKAYEAAWDRYIKGLKPEKIVV